MITLLIHKRVFPNIVKLLECCIENEAATATIKNFDLWHRDICTILDSIVTKEQHRVCSNTVVGAPIGPILFQVMIQRLRMAENQGIP